MGLWPFKRGEKTPPPVESPAVAADPRGWWFAPRPVEAGTVERFSGEPVPGHAGLHAAPGPLSALPHAKSAHLCLVEISGAIVEVEDQMAATRRKVVFCVDADAVLRELAVGWIEVILGTPLETRDVHSDAATAARRRVIDAEDDVRNARWVLDEGAGRADGNARAAAEGRLLGAERAAREARATAEAHEAAAALLEGDEVRHLSRAVERVVQAVAATEKGDAAEALRSARDVLEAEVVAAITSVAPAEPEPRRARPAPSPTAPERAGLQAHLVGTDEPPSLDDIVGRIRDLVAEDPDTIDLRDLDVHEALIIERRPRLGLLIWRRAEAGTQKLLRALETDALLRESEVAYVAVWGPQPALELRIGDWLVGGEMRAPRSRIDESALYVAVSAALEDHPSLIRPRLALDAIGFERSGLRAARLAPLLDLRDAVSAGPPIRSLHLLRLPAGMLGRRIADHIPLLACVEAKHVAATIDHLTAPGRLSGWPFAIGVVPADAPASAFADAATLYTSTGPWGVRASRAELESAAIDASAQLSLLKHDSHADALHVCAQAHLSRRTGLWGAGFLRSSPDLRIECDVLAVWVKGSTVAARVVAKLLDDRFPELASVVTWGDAPLTDRVRMNRTAQRALAGWEPDRLEPVLQRALTDEAFVQDPALRGATDTKRPRISQAPAWTSSLATQIDRHLVGVGAAECPRCKRQYQLASGVVRCPSCGRPIEPASG